MESSAEPAQRGQFYSPVKLSIRPDLRKPANLVLLKILALGVEQLEVLLFTPDAGLSVSVVALPDRLI